MAQNFMDRMSEIGEERVRLAVERRMAVIRREAEDREEEKRGFLQELAPALTKYSETKELFTTYKLGKAVYGRRYLDSDQLNGEYYCFVLPAKIGATLQELAEIGVLKCIEGVNNPHCPYLYQFA